MSLGSTRLETWKGLGLDFQRSGSNMHEASQCGTRALLRLFYFVFSVFDFLLNYSDVVTKAVIWRRWGHQWAANFKYRNAIPMQIVSLLQNKNTWTPPLNRESALDTFLDLVKEDILKITPQTLLNVSDKLLKHLY